MHSLKFKLSLTIFALFLTANANAENWKIDKTQDEFTDVYTYHLRAESNDKAIYIKKGMISINCSKENDGISFGVSLADEYSSFSNETVTYRVDNKKAIKKEWILYSESMGVFFNIEPKKLLSEMIGSNKLLIGFKSNAGTMETFTFSLAGFDKQFKNLEKKCAINLNEK